MTDIDIGTGAALGLGSGLGFVVAVVVSGLRQRLQGTTLRAQAAQIVREAEVERERLLRAAEAGAKEALLAAQQEHDRELERQRDELVQAERRLRQRESHLERKVEGLERRERELKKRETGLQAEIAEVQTLRATADQQVQAVRRELAEVARLSPDEAREQLVAAMQGEARQRAAAHIKRIELEARSAAQERAQRVIAAALQRFASAYVSEKTVSVVELPSDDMKGRIIGREGRNIRAIEAATGVDVIIDDTPEVVVLSAFNPIRREIARLALERLVADGRIHPAHIEEVVGQAAADMDQLVVRAGEQAALDLGLHGLHADLIKLVGKLKYRVVNGQNSWQHSMETAVIAGMLATELGLNATAAKRAGLLHDIGKAVDHEVENDHATIAADLARRYGEKAPVVEAIAQHHDVQPASVLGGILQAADSLSKARPGARRDLLDTYVRRLEDLERISLSFAGVDKAYAIQAGREVRVMVDYARISDDEAFVLSGDIARRIADELTYPGEVRVAVIREARATDIAR